ncbi:phospholipase ABHD3-like [Anastrepha obliqua]|uniref:phospholipase ABHD3-like n=1 Tax=Anastrepha obliqua TaxID=95512 RepID=UPI00240A7757|nr:phospholipase ABHD3-like [Anastrepha obliqua]XP_054739717.1 phospholipase ABHD3-like [Anastrepha obliqua]XP_054739718.1 phospholipase ABHD3-like [Anastrepha obliqua]XP_054739719.1 phospholipase ABHD3-like [Anastrepha obliqua]
MKNVSLPLRESFHKQTKRNMFYSMYCYLSNIPRWHALAFALGAYVVYYFIQVVKRPILACADGPFKEFLQRNVPTLEMKFWPTFWCVESRAQTVFASILRSQIIPNINYRREILTLKDGGEVALDWLEENCGDDAPCIIILPGLTGESQAEYIKCLVIAANNVGMRVVVFNNRGLGGIELKTPRLYCASNCEDLSEVVRHVRKTIPTHCKLGATGISMGGLILGNYLVRKSEESRKCLSAAKIISVPWDVHKGTANIEKPILNNLLGRHLASSLCRTLDNCKIYKDQDIDLDRIMSCKTIKEFDALFTSKQFGYAHVDDYYSDATLHNKLHYISVPLLCLSAADDPFQPLDAIPIKAAEECTHVAIVVTARGGHIGFLEGWWPSPKEQYMGRLFSEFFTKALFDADGHFERTRDELHQRFDAKNIAPLQAPTPLAISKATTPLLSAEEFVEKFMEM